MLRIWMQDRLQKQCDTRGSDDAQFFVEPITKADDWKLEFLERFLVFLEEWSDPSRNYNGLTLDTAKAAKQTCAGLIELSR